jgi:energy-coupling factor transporter ATP-binding protein EcfA2
MVPTLEEIRDSGKTFDYVYGVWQRSHSGDSHIGKMLLLSVGCQCITNSKNGIHVSLTGPKGCGKSDSAKKMIVLLPEEWTYNASISPKFLYGSNLRDGTTILIDDMAWDDELGVTVKRITTDFATGSRRGTKKDMECRDETTPARLTFWVTSVDNQADEQLRDRFLMSEVEDSPERTEERKNFMKRVDMGYEDTIIFDDEIKLCQDLITDMKNNNFNVVIPFADRIDIKGDTRAYGIFSNMVKSFAIFNYRLRETDENGRLIATEEDFYKAKEIFELFGGHSSDKYSSTEKKVLQIIVDNGHRATARDIIERADITRGTLSIVMNGRNDREKHGLLYKCKGLNTDKMPSGIIVYTLPFGYQVQDNIEQVTLIPESRLIMNADGTTEFASA